MITSLFRFVLAASFLLGNAVAVPEKPAESPAAPAAAAPAKNDPDVLVLPKIQVTASRIKQLDREIKRLDKAIAREKKNLKATDLDRALNHEKLAKAAVLFGGNSSEHMVAVRATRIQYMETEKGLLADMKEPRSLEEVKLIEETLEQIRTLRRELDLPIH